MSPKPIIGKFTATKVADGVKWEWVSLDGKQNEAFVDHDISAIGPQSLGNVFSMLAHVIPSYKSEVFLLKRSPAAAYHF